MNREFDQKAIERIALETDLEIDDIYRVLNLYEFFEGDSEACLCAAWYPHECACCATWDDEED